MGDETAVLLHLNDGSTVRVSESLDTAVDLITGAENTDGWAAFEDPGDGRAKLVRARLVTQIEQEPDNG